MTATTPAFQLPDSDPEAGLVLGPEGAVLMANPAANTLRGKAGKEDVADLLPVNIRALINSHPGARHRGRGNPPSRHGTDVDIHSGPGLRAGSGPGQKCHHRHP